MFRVVAQQPTAPAQPSAQPSAQVHHYLAGETSAPRLAPEQAVALRFPFGRCRIWARPQQAWQACGEASAGHVHVAAPGLPVRTEWLSDGDELILTVPHDYWRERITARMREFLAKGRPRRCRDPVQQQLARLLLRSGAEHAQPAFDAPLIDALLMRSVVNCSDAPHHERSTRRHQALPVHRMARLKDYVQQHLPDSVSLSDMAQAVGMSPMHFAAQFREATGQRPHDYLLEQRIQRAKQLMASTGFSLYDVALAVGFNTQAHFCTVFRRFAGTTPGQWRLRGDSHAA